jgi:hypothetical protein
VGLLVRGPRYVPPFNTYYPSIEDAAPGQQAYYFWLLSEFHGGRTPDVQGNLSYLFVYVYQVIGDFIRTNDYAALAHWFEFLRGGYAAATKIGGYLDIWQGDAALLAEAWPEAWECKRRQRLDIDLIVNVLRHCPDPALSAGDLHALLGSDDGLTETGRRRLEMIDREADVLLGLHHSANSMNAIDSFIKEYAWRDLTDTDLERIADDCEYLVSAQRLKNAYRREPCHSTVDRPLFSGVLLPWVTREDPPTDFGNGLSISVTTRMRAMNPTVSLIHVSPAIELAALAQCKRILREAENNVREREGLPRIGEGWVSETELFCTVRAAFPNTRVLQHARPEWLSPQHLDVYLPEFSIAVEFQGAQHVGPVDYFGGEKAYEEQKRRDARKKKLCAKNECVLIEVFQGYVASEIVAAIHSHTCQLSGRLPRVDS